MGSVTVTGTSTISTFIRMREPGWILSAPVPVSAGAAAPAGAPAGGVPAAPGGGTWTLLSGSSWACAKEAMENNDASPQINRRLLSRNGLPRWLELSYKIGNLLMLTYQRLKAILARSARSWRHSLVIGLSVLKYRSVPSENMNRGNCWGTIDPRRARSECEQNLAAKCDLGPQIHSSSPGARPFPWPASIHFALGAIIPPPFGWKTWLPNPTTRSHRPCNRPTINAAPSTWSASFLDCLNSLTLKEGKAFIREQLAIFAPGGNSRSWSRKKTPASLPTRSVSGFPGRRLSRNDEPLLPSASFRITPTR